MPAELNRTAHRALYRGEPGHSQPRSPDGRTIKYRQLVSAIACLLPAAVLAGPKNGQVVAGVADISTPDANTTVIRQSTNKSVINWQSFSIGSQEYVKFVQPDKSSLSLNRVIGGNPSSILGKLSANGQVYLVNPNGIYFGQGAQVDVSGIVASVLDISNADFMNGKFVFQGDADANLGKVINDGIINARNEGYVVLLGDYSENNGVIQAHMGKVVLASGSHITMDISGNNLISVAVNEAAVSELAGVKNSGDIYADGGRVIMTARVADNLIGSAVNNEGLIRASSIVEQDGAIFLTASGGDITNSGVLDASAALGSNVDGGGVLVYSDKNITLAPGGEVNARGDGSGAGGVARVIAEDVLDFQSGAAISVSGAPQAGGIVEISGHAGLVIRGDVDTGSGGNLVIDPALLRITNSGDIPPTGSTGDGSTGTVAKGFIEGQLKLNTNVTLIANSSIVASPGSLGSSTPTFEITALSGNGNLTIMNGTVGGSGLFATPDCSIGVCLPGNSVGVTQGSTGSINLATVSININGGLKIAAGSDVGTVSIGAINAGGNVSITAGSNINLEGVISGAGTSLAVTAGNVGNTTNSNSNINLNAGIGLSTASPLNADVTLNANNDVNIDADIFLGNNTLKLAADHADGVSSTGDSVGDVNITGIPEQTLSVRTQGAMTITGQDFNLLGAASGTVGFSSGSTPANVAVSANDITVTVTGGNMNVAAGDIFLRLDDQTGFRDVSVSLTAVNNITITAVDLNVKGGTTARVEQTSGSSVTGSVIANAEISAGNNMTLNLRDLNVSGGFASASGTGASSAVLHAEANARLFATNNMTLNVSRDLKVTGGTANVRNSAESYFADAQADVHANAEISAGNIQINSVGGVLEITTKTATADFTATDGCGTGASLICTTVATADAKITGADVTISSVGSTLTVRGGTANARMIASSSTCSNCNVSASANALLEGTNTLTVVNVTDDVLITGQNATAFGSTMTDDCRFCTVDANANATVTGGAVSIRSVGGDLRVTGGNAIAGASNLSLSFGTATLSANAQGNLTATGNLTVDVAGTLAVTGNVAFAIGGGSWSGGVSVGAFANADALVTAASLSITAGTELVASGGIATVTFSGTGSGTISASAKAELKAGGQATINVTAGSVALVGGISNPGNSSFSQSAGRGARASGSSGTTPLRKAFANASVKAGLLRVMAATDVFGSSASIDAGGIYIATGNDLQLFNTTTTVGNGPAPGVSGDSLMLDIMEKAEIPLPANNDPNLKFLASGSIDPGDIEATASNAYLWFETDVLSVGNISAPSGPLTVQYSPFTPTHNIAFEDLPASPLPLQVNYDNSNHVASLPMTTVVIGSAQQSGPITVGANGMIDIGARNILLLTTPDSVTLPSNIITTGIVATSGYVGSVREEVFVTPRLDNFTVETESWWLEAERRKQQLVEKGDDDHGMCIAL